MIFSLSTLGQPQAVSEIVDTDIFCFFHSHHSVQVPENVLWISVLSSLKMKRNVLLLEENPVELPTLGSARWLVGDKFLYLAPRAGSVLFEAVFHHSMTYQSVKPYLISFK